jgi:hypothetical protein
LSCEATAFDVESALEGLTTISNVDVIRTVNNNGYNYEVKFWHPRGDVVTIYALDDMLTGPDAAARVATFDQGTAPADYGYEVVAGAANRHTISGLDSGTGYFVRVAAITSQGRGAYTGPGIDGSGDGSEAWYGKSIAEANMEAATGPLVTGAIAPVEAPSAPLVAELYALEPSLLRVAWALPASNGGQNVVRYLVQWDVSADFRNIKTSGYEASVAATLDVETECYDIEIAAVSASVPRFVRVSAYNGYDYSDFAMTSPSSAVGSVRTPGPPKAPTLDVTRGRISQNLELPSIPRACYHL